MDFIVDKENKRIKVTRKFSAPLGKVWDAWTNSNILDQWWAPKPWKARTKKMDFREGGYWLYAMVGPNNEEHWARIDYQDISPKKSFKAADSFCDSEGNISTELPSSIWLCQFNESAGSTEVNIDIEYGSVTDLEKYIEMGFKEGFTMALNNLDELL